MKHPSLWKVSIATSAEAEDAVTELVADTLGQPATSYRDIETGQAWVTAYFEGRRGLRGNWREDLQEGLRRVRACGLDTAPGRITLAQVRWEDWAESWKRHFRPIRIGSALLIKPSWSRLMSRAGQATVVLDPGLSFGTGQHPTTAFCLEQIVHCRRRGERQAMLDIGTGSGILAIAAAKLGYAPVHAFDLDPEAIRVARANARQNGVAGQIRFARRDLARLSNRGRQRCYPMICANLISSVLLAERQRILNRLQAGGVLVLAGILSEEFPAIRAAYEASGVRLVASQQRREWRSGAFSRGAPTARRRAVAA